MEISPEEPREGKQRLLMSVCRKGRTMAPQLPAAHRAEPHLRHLDLEWTPALRSTGMVTWARLSQWVNPVQHEGFSRLPRSQRFQNAAVRCWPDIEYGSKSKTTNALDADRATLDKASPFAQVLWGPGLVTGDITGHVVPQRHFMHMQTDPSHSRVLEPPTGTTKGAKEVEVGQWGSEDT